MSELKKLSEKISSLRSETITVDEFHKWVIASNSILSKSISPGVLLKLKRGDISKIMSVSKSMNPSCSACNSVFKEGVFKDRKEHKLCVSSVKNAISENILAIDKRPHWYTPALGQLGPETYYSCANCGAIWSLVEPERHCNGLWERVA